MGYFNVTASGAGVSGTTLPLTGTVTFTFSTTLEYANTYPLLSAIDANGNVLANASPPSTGGASWEEAVLYISDNSPATGTVNMATFMNAFSSYNTLAGLSIRLDTGYSSADEYVYEQFYFWMITNCREPTSPKLSATLSRDTVKLSWGAGSAGTNNSVTGYDVQRRESSDGNSWGSWEDVPGSPVTTTEINVSPPNTAGNYYQYQVRTRGSAGSNYYSGWVTSTNTLRRKWDAFGAWTDDPLVAGETPIKAIHMQELQSRVNTLYSFYGLGTYSFTTITAGTTSLAGWTTHVNQIRTAIEDVCSASGKIHEDWISFSVNCPRADIIQQLRNVILAL